jgi:hypothetical protein
MKMGVGGISADDRALAQRLVAQVDEYVRQYEGQGLGDSIDREVELIRRGCCRLELTMWQTSPLFLRNR